ncbi:MAG: hypothetical protein AMXMBFR33_21010 [Candidatus Xenobia bacterium]
MKRRNFFKLGAAAAGLGLARVTLEPWWLETRRVTIELDSLPPELDGITIAQLSDLHRGPWVPEALLRNGLEAARNLGADMIVLTGDFLSVSASYAPSLVALVSELRAPLGVYAVLGNHDLWVRGREPLARGFARHGIQLLINRAVQLRHRGAAFWVVGVDDCWAGRPDLALALRDVPADQFRLLLAHEPDFADLAASFGVPLQLSGHSHGGQVRLPLLGPVVLPPHGRKYPMGLYRLASGTQVYTNVGLGVVSPPIRLGCPPELSHLTLRSRPA